MSERGHSVTGGTMGAGQAASAGRHSRGKPIRRGARGVPAGQWPHGGERPVRDHRLLARLLSYVRAHPLLLVVAALLVLVTDLLHVLVPYLTKIGIDRDVAAGDLAGLGRTTLLLCAALVGQLGGQVAFTYTVEYLGQRLLYDLRMSLFQKVLGLGHDYFDRTAVGATLTNVTNDVEAIRQFISQGLVSLLGDSFQVVVILGAMLLINPRLALAAFITLPFFGVVTWLFRNTIRRGYGAVREANAQINTTLVEAITGMREVTLLNYQKRIRATFTAHNRRYLEAFLRVVNSYSYYFPALELLATLSLIIVLGYAHRAVGATVQPGEIFAFFAYIMMLYRPLRQLAERFNTFQATMAAASRIFALLDRTESIREPEQPLLPAGASAGGGGAGVAGAEGNDGGGYAGARTGRDGGAVCGAAGGAASSGGSSIGGGRGDGRGSRPVQVALEQVQFAYDAAQVAGAGHSDASHSDAGRSARARHAVAGGGSVGAGHPVLEQLSFTIKPGERVALVGSTGAGKSTVINLINRLYDVQQGRVLVDGVDVRRLPLAYLRRRIATVPQDLFLFSGSIADNISLRAPGVTRAQVEAAAAAVGATLFVRALPDGFDHNVLEEGKSLSSGQKQLLAFARAFLLDPGLVIMDEATANIDTESERVIEQSLATLLRGRTAIVIAHRLSTIRSVERILVLHRGRLVEEGTHADLLARNGVYARLYRMQLLSLAPGTAVP